NPALDVSQYAHAVWKTREGFTNGAINALAQTPDGYLWLGTESGLVRFDGVKNTPFPYSERLPAKSILSLLAARDGSLWIGTEQGLASWKNGSVRVYPELAGSVVFRIIEDHEGSLWIASASPVKSGRLCTFRHDSMQCYGEDGSFGNSVLSVFEDSKH